MSVFIKDVELKSNLILAPMAGFTDLAFRVMCKDFGAGLTCTEMISSMALHYKNKKTEELLGTLDDETPKAVQIFGHDPVIMAEAVRNPLLEKFDVIDINMGCPARKITSNGDGSALMKDFDRAEEIIRACVGATDKPITVKFRLGIDENSVCAVEFAKMCERAGASAISVHGRTARQGYAGDVDYEVIGQVKKSVKIPVFANGDCRSREDYLKILEVTGADGVMLGRAALGCPEKFAEILTGKKLKENKFRQMLFHYETMRKYYPEKYVVLYMRSHLARYLGSENKQILLTLMQEKSYDNIKQILLSNADK